MKTNNLLEEAQSSCMDRGRRVEAWEDSRGLRGSLLRAVVDLAGHTNPCLGSRLNIHRDLREQMVAVVGSRLL